MQVMRSSISITIGGMQMCKPDSRTIGTIIQRITKYIERYEDAVVTQIAEQTDNDPFRVLISCLISLRTKDEVTAVASARLFKLADTPQKLVKLQERTIARCIYPAGFYKTKAKRIKEICGVLLEQYRGKVPETLEQLKSLKGVGPKTAAIVMTYGHGSDDHIPTDSHVHQIANRLGWVKTSMPEDTEQALMRLVPKRYWHDLNNTFVTFGQKVCVPISPWCSRCPVEEYCPKIGVKKSR